MQNPQVWILWTIIKEADIANLNIIAEAGGKDIFNWSIVTQAVKLRINGWGG